jgi:hypothetical protein
MKNKKSFSIPRLLGIEALHPTTKRVMIIRGLRSMGQGAMVVD